MPPYRRFIAIDGSRRMLEQVPDASAILDDPTQLDQYIPKPPQPALVHGELQDVLPHLVERADVLFAFLSLPENDEPGELLRLFHRSLRRGGRALIVTNVLVPRSLLPDPPSGESLLRAASVDPFRAENHRRRLYVLVQTPTGLIPIVEEAHVPADYHDPERWQVRDAQLLPWENQTLVDASDRDALRRHFPGHDHGGAVALEHAEAAVMHLCLELVKVRHAPDRTGGLTVGPLER